MGVLIQLSLPWASFFLFSSWLLQVSPYQLKTLGSCVRRRASTRTRQPAQSSTDALDGAVNLSWCCSSVHQEPSGCLETPSALIWREMPVRLDSPPKQQLLQLLQLQQQHPPQQRQPQQHPPQQFPPHQLQARPQRVRRQQKRDQTQARQSAPGLDSDPLLDTMSG